MFWLYRRNQLEGYNEIEITIRNLKTKEGYNIQQFILTYLHGDSQSADVWEFVDAVSESLDLRTQRKYGDTCKSCVENFIFPVLYNKMKKEINLENEDELLLVSKWPTFY